VKGKYSIIFMGTPDFAVPTLQALVRNDHDVALIVTQPDRPKGRGRRPAAPPVKLKALELNLDWIQPSTLKNEDFIDRLRRIQPDFLVVIAFGHLLTEKILQLPKFGAINIHASLLPKYRGPAPIQWAIINGERQTGITTMLMDKGLDTGDILLTQKEPILAEDTSGALHDRLALRGADLLIRTLESFASGNIKPQPQDHSRATYAPLLKKEDGHINWQKSAEQLQAFVRGMTPWPGAFTYHHQNRLKVLRAAAEPENVAQPPGTILAGFPGDLRVAAGRHVLSILEIQGPSGKRLAIADFLRGYPLPPGSHLK
jgi:methionyl-tRNA formyltransferase